MASRTETQSSSADGGWPGATAGAVAARLERLHALAAGEPAAAQDDAWAWFAELGRRIVGEHRAEALAELGGIFRAGRPSRGIDGLTEGAAVGGARGPLLDRIAAAITTAWLPWAGKAFEAEAGRGRNLLHPSARLPARIPWPAYAMGSESGYATAFEFNTYVGPSALDPGRDVLVIDYASVERNPRLIIRSIRDELVEVVPGAHLGQIVWIHRGGERHSLLGYFALKSAL